MSPITATGVRVSPCLCVDGHKKGTGQTVLRGGYGFFYDRFGFGSLLNMQRYSGGATRQIQDTITNPTCFSA